MSFFHVLPFSHFFHPRCMLSCLLFVVLTYTHCASQAPERSCRILACLSAQQYGGACFVFRVFLSRCTHIRKAFTKLEFPPKCCSSVFKRRDRGDGMCRTEKTGGGEEDERTVFPLPFPPYFSIFVRPPPIPPYTRLMSSFCFLCTFSPIFRCLSPRSFTLASGRFCSVPVKLKRRGGRFGFSFSFFPICLAWSILKYELVGPNRH